MTPNENEATQLAHVAMIRDLDLTKNTLECVAASLMFHLYKGDETKMLKFIALIDERLENQ